MDNIINSRLLGLSNRLTTACHISQSYHPYVLISTPFSLPFSRWTNKPIERISWLNHRFSLFSKALKRCIKNQRPLGFTVIWVVFLSRGDKLILGLPPFELFANNIILLYIEVDTNPSFSDNDYRLYSMPRLLKSVLNIFVPSSCSNIPVITMRIDSDDLISSDYIYLLTYCTQFARDSGFTDLFLAFEHGILYESDTSRLVPRIWPEPAFLARFEYDIINNIRTVWDYSHDVVPLSSHFAHIITTAPQWCVTVGSDNIANKMIFYHYDIHGSINLSQIFTPYT